MAKKARSARKSPRPAAVPSSRRLLSRLSSFMDSSVDAFVILDEDLNFVSINPAAREMFGLTEDVIGKNVADIVPGIKEAGIYDKYLSVVKTGVPLPIEDVAPGSRFGDIRLNVKAFKAGSGLGVIAADITEQKRVEEELRRKEEHFRSLIENSLDAVGVLNADGSLRYQSPSIQRLMGYTVEERIDRSPFEVVHPDDLPRAAELFSGLLQRPGDTVRSEVRIQYKDGSWHTIEVIARNLLDDPVVGGIVANLRDITERKEMEEALRESEEFSASLLRDSPNPIIVINPDSSIRYVNPALEELTGFSSSELIGTMIPYPWWTEETLQKTGEAVKEWMYRGPTGLKKFYAEERFRKKNGEHFWVELSTTMVEGDCGLKYYLTNWVDITERREMEEALRRSEYNYRLLLDSTLDGLIVVDAETMKVVFGNRRASRLFGYGSVEEGIGVHILDFVQPEDRELVVKGFARDLFIAERRQVYELKTKTREGREIWVSALATRIEYEGRLAVLLSIRDITERKRAEEESHRMEEQVRLAGRLAAVGELAAGVAHELNNPLAAIQGFAQLLASKKNLDESIREDVEAIYSEAKRAGRITGNLLSFARRHHPEKKIVSINDALEKSLELHAYRMKVNNIEVHEDLDPDLPMTMADFHQMQEVFVNLLTNAEQAMTEASGRGKLLVRTRKAGDMIRISFIDDGPGIPEEDLKRLFDPFFTTKEAGRGTGLGLSICYGLVGSHGGHIYVKSMPGKGANFTVEIPIVAEGQNGAE